MQMTLRSLGLGSSTVLLVGALSALTACTSSAPPREDGDTRRAPTIHTVTASAQGLFVNAYLVEGETGVVAVDSALTVSDGQHLRSRLDEIGKPLLAVLLTHGHPDHYNGVATLVGGDPLPPIYATRDVARVVREWDDEKEAQWGPVFGEEWPAERQFPTHELGDGERLTIDGLRWTVHAVGPGESHADSYWTLDADRRYVFLGDIVLHQMHAYVTDGHTGAWLETLERLGSSFEDVAGFYPGHGEAGGVELFEWQARYLETYRREVDALREGGATLSESAKEQLVTRMTQHYPDAGLEFLIALGADAVAAELAMAD